MSEELIDVKYVAKLARIELTAAEVEQFQGQLEDVLKHVEQISQLDLSGVEPMAHANLIYDRMRRDEPGESLSAEAALSNAPDSVAGQFRVPKVIDS